MWATIRKWFHAFIGCAAVVGFLATAPTTRAEFIKVEVIGDDDYQPYSYVEDGEAKGIYVDVLREAFSRMKGFEVSIRMLPWKRGLAEIANGEAFAIFPPYYWPDQRPFIAPYSQPLFSEQVAVFCGRDVLSQERPEWPSDYYGLRIGNNSGFLTPGEEFFGAVNSGLIDLFEVKDTNTGLRMLIHGRVDCFVNDRLAILWELGKLREAGKYDPAIHKIAQGALGPGQMAYVGYTNRAQRDAFPFRKEFIRQLDAVLKGMHEKGDIQKIVDAVFGQHIN